MNITPTRFLHIEDDWEQFRTLPNNLFDLVYSKSDPEVKFTLDFEEFENADDNPECFLCYQWKTYIGDSKSLLFDYCLIDSLENFSKVNLRKDDFLIIDIMQVGDEGSAQEVASKVVELSNGASEKPIGNMFFSAYPELKPKGLDLEGFDKIKVDRFLNKLLSIIFREHPTYSADTENWFVRPADLGMVSVVEKYDRH